MELDPTADFMERQDPFHVRPRRSQRTTVTVRCIGRQRVGQNGVKVQAQCVTGREAVSEDASLSVWR